MPNVTYNSFMHDVVLGNIAVPTDSFKLLLVTSSYSPDKDAHLKRSAVTNEVSGSGYVAGGSTVTLTAAKDNATDRVTISLGNVSWPSSTITARGGVIYKSRGGAASADELVAYVDFGADVTSTAATFTVTPGTPFILQN